VSISAIERISIADLKAAKRNARTHSRRQVRQIADSIKRFGFTNPVLVDDENGILAGHGRVAAAKELGLADLPCLRLSDMSDGEKRAYILADNKLALNAGWDTEILAIELQQLIALDFDVGVIGFELPEVDLIIAEAVEASAAPTPEDEPVAPALAAEVVTQLGDLWVLGRHRLLCGDAKEAELVERLMDGERAHMIFTDPPYNVPIQGHVSGLGRVQHREFAEAVGEMSAAQFTAFLTETLTHAAAACCDGAIAFVCMDWRHLQEVLQAGHTVFSELKNLCVWKKSNAGMGTFYRSQHELVLVWKVGSAPHTNTFGLGDKGRYRTNVWTYAGANAFKTERMEELASHPTVKPVSLVADAIRDVSHRGEIVLDVFGGSGSTLIAAEKTGRLARLLELDPGYCDVIVQRWMKLTGKTATLLDGGASFEDVKASRTGWVGASEGWAA
jgi:DNA modification methylase